MGRKESRKPSNYIGIACHPGPNHPGGKLTLDTEGNLYTVIGDLNNEGYFKI